MGTDGHVGYSDQLTENVLFFRYHISIFCSENK
jgi:hypothetical protein